MTEPDAEPDEDYAPLGSIDAEVRHLLGLFDVPSFARRGQDMEGAIDRVHARCDRAREAMLEMVHVRLRQWAGVSAGPDDWSDTFDGPVAPLWTLGGAPESPRWADRAAAPRRRRAVARDLAASVDRFNHRWSRFVAELDLGPVNHRIEAYNRYYVLEKECALGSHRLAARLFRPVDPLSAGALLARHPLLPTPRPIH